MFDLDGDFKNIMDIQGRILNSENVGICVIKKDDCKVLYCNKKSEEFTFKGIEVGKTYEQYINKEIPKSRSWVNLDEEKINYNTMGEKWIIKTIEGIYDGIEVIIIYGKVVGEYLKDISNFDLLTNSLSYAGLQEYYNNFVKKNKINYYLCTVDVDKFKYINNLFGYRVGDEILYRISETIQEFIECKEAYCRISDDRFGILLKYTKYEDLEKRLESLRIKFIDMQINDFPDKKLTIVGGVCLVDKEKELHNIMDKANIARKAIKGSHENKIRIYDDKLKEEVKREKLIEERTLYAVKNDEFEPYLQAKFDLETNKICGAEALVRWIAPDGIVFPDEFIPIFEKSGFITILDFIIYEKVLGYMRKCLDNGISICPISLNASRGHIKNNNFSDRFMELVNRYRIPLDLIELELTESAFIEDKNKLKYFIEDLKKYNIKVSIDDFGTAYSSLNVLKDIDVDILKIDKEFLKNINFIKVTEIPTKDKVILKHIVTMAKDLGFHAICEGVETREQMEFLKDIGCELGQGYFFAKPMPISEFTMKYYNTTI